MELIPGESRNMGASGQDERESMLLMLSFLLLSTADNAASTLD